MPGGDEPKVVFCTTENGIDHIARALDGGANEYIMKPFDKDIVTAKFQEVGLIRFGCRPRPVPRFASSYQVASGRDMSIEPIAGEEPSPRLHREERSSAPPDVSSVIRVRIALQTDIRFTVKSSGDVNPKSFQFISRGRP